MKTGSYATVRDAGGSCVLRFCTWLGLIGFTAALFATWVRSPPKQRSEAQQRTFRGLLLIAGLAAFGKSFLSTDIEVRVLRQG